MSEYIVRMPSDMPYEIKSELNAWYVNSEPIVRCRDCKHYDPHPTDDGVCFLPDGNGGFAYWEVEPDGYCKWGERREP